jgi:hypothetical protein
MRTAPVVTLAASTLVWALVRVSLLWRAERTHDA